MGYSTEFTGSLKFNKPLDEATEALWRGLARSRRMKRDINILAKKYGKELRDAVEEWGEDASFYYGSDSELYIFDKTIINYNEPPDSQPGLWLQWIYDKNTNSLMWDDGEKFYHYVEWLEYLVEKIFKPRGYILNGEIEWRGEDPDDTGVIIVIDNVIARKTFEDFISMYKTQLLTESVIKLAREISRE